MPLHTGRFPKKDLSEREKKLAREMAGEGERPELGYLFIDATGTGGYFITVSDIYDGAYTGNTLIQRVTSYLNEMSGLPDYYPNKIMSNQLRDASNMWHISANYIELKEGDVETLMPLFAEQGKERVYRISPVNKQSRRIDLADMKAMAIDWKHFSERPRGDTWVSSLSNGSSELGRG